MESPLAVESFTLLKAPTNVPQREQEDEVGEKEEEQNLEKKDQEVAAWLATYRLGHVRGALRHLGVESLEDLALHVKNEDTGQLALRSTIEVRRFCWAPQNLRTPMSALRSSTEQGGANAVFKAAKEAISPDKGKLDLDCRAEAIETNNNARSDHGGGEAAHRQLLKEQTNKTIILKGKLDLDFRTEVIETNNNARSDHGGGEAAHRQLLKE
eukprot:CAMPEP_0171618144 /NCGR_PEP_ID=MMETSP0990-20121206/14561_1 /TAXON_ID=483369 /ORGANISM="non described non described, Strain CCMP2098" /LENGTH=211 /DNA_ID=CAMNT_0012182871 /DNA_START=38 /DNA_END=673 /DNA_ORIENTATION=+